MDITSGLTLGGNLSPLRTVRIHVHLLQTAAQVEVTQEYTNSRSDTLEALYVFPLEEGAAVTAFSARIGERTVQAELRARDKAFEQYAAAISAGDGAYLLEQQRANQFSASLGNVPAGADISVTLRYVTECRWDRDGIRLMLPTTLTPRYRPQSQSAEDVEPQFSAATGTRLAVECTIEDAAQYAVIDSPSHQFTHVDRDGRTVLALQRDNVVLDRDIVIRLQPHTNLPAALVRRRAADGSEFLQLTFRPASLPDQQRPRELIYVLDCSGSMSGDTMKAARRALELCLRAMRPGDSFNICRFGSTFDLLWAQPQPYSKTTLTAALKHLKATDADLGGTEIAAPLRAVMDAPLSSGVSRRDVLVLTDGAVSNEDEVIAAAGSGRDRSRIFTFGIGTASDLLIRGLARNSGGAAEFIAPNERIEPAILRIFGRLNEAAFEDLQIDWDGLTVEQAPQELPALFSGDLLTVYARITGGRAAAVTVNGAGEPLVLALPADAADEAVPLISALWARTMIRSLEEHSGNTPTTYQRRTGMLDGAAGRMRDISLQFGVLSRETAFVAVEERQGTKKTTGHTVFIQVANQLPVSWQQQHASGHALYAQPLDPSVVYSMAAPIASAPFDTGADSELPAFRRARPSRRSSPRARPTAETAAADAAVDRLYSLLVLQEFDGSFPRAALDQLPADIAGAILALVPPEQASAAATAAVIGWCRSRQAGREAEWRSAVAKAEHWLAAQPAGDILLTAAVRLFA